MARGLGDVYKRQVIEVFFTADYMDEPGMFLPFTDVPAGCWYTDAIVWAAQNGIVCGFGDGTFRPNEAVTRAQAAVMLYGYAAFTGADVTARADLSAYSDAGQIPSWAMDAMQWANARRLIVGRDSSHLAPNGGATRAEMAAILSAYIGK